MTSITAPRTQDSRWFTPAAIVAAALVLAAPTLWNGFPFLFWDTVDYIDMPFTGVIPPFRTASYVLAMLPSVITGTLWATVTAQCLITAFVLHEVLDAFLPSEATFPARRALVPVAAVLTVTTALPWYTGQLMADVFTGLVVLGIATLAFGREASWPRRLALAAIVALGIAVHTSHVAVAAGLVVVLLSLRAIARVSGACAWLKPNLTGSVGALVGGLLLASVANWAISGQFYLAQSNANLMFARLLQDGIAHDYLAEVCPRGAALRLCGERDRLPHNANTYLWSPGSFYDLGGWKSEALKEESAFIIRDSIRRHPARHLKVALELAWTQFWMLKTGDGLIGLDTIHEHENTTVKSMFMPRHIADRYPGDLDAYWGSEQRNDVEMTDFNRLHVPMALVGLASLVMFGGMAVSRRDRREAGLILVVTCALLGNAFVCGALSNPLDRYQARVVWIAVFAGGIAAARRVAVTRDTAHRGLATGEAGGGSPEGARA